MTGPEHYREAERLAQLVKRHSDSVDAVAIATVAQVHATLALAAATAEANPEIGAYLPHDKQSVLPWLGVLIAKDGAL
ncbi:hypothetical protein [Kitasatospora sp. NPDC005748]|uniref:hypothetical protein n=1 Tax=Kitasatospora sp. NPDC005748 TaxID=3157063 RepID=UPI00340DE52C